MEETKMIRLNEQEMTEAEFEETKKKLLEQKGVQLVEVSPGVYKTRFFD